MEREEFEDIKRDHIFSQLQGTSSKVRGIIEGVYLLSIDDQLMYFCRQPRVVRQNVVLTIKVRVPKGIVEVEVVIIVPQVLRSSSILRDCVIIVGNPMTCNISSLCRLIQGPNIVIQLLLEDQHLQPSIWEELIMAKVVGIF